MVVTRPSPERVLKIGPVEIDTALREVRHDGTPVPVEPKPFELLLYLIDNGDRVVRRDELMDALWPGVVVSEATLSSAVRRARDVLGSERERIRVVRKVGYRFSVAAAETRNDSGTPRPREVAESGPRFVGRSHELAHLADVLDAGVAGRGGCVAIAGDAGVGKSRTIAELVHRARGLGAEALVGRCYEGEGGQALWPWVQIFRGFAATRNESELAEILQSEANDIGRLTAAVSSRDPESAVSDPEMQRARLLDSVVTVLRRAAAKTPILLALEDLHWADNATLLLLRALADTIDDVPIVVVVTYRSAEITGNGPLASLRAWLRQRRQPAEIELGGLRHRDVADLLCALAEYDVERSIVDAVFAATEGNPLFAREYWHDLTESEAVTTGATGWIWRSGAAELGIPATVRDIIGRRLQRLGPATNQLLTVGAVIGREFGHEVLGRVTTQDEAAVVDALDHATFAGVIDEVAGSTGRYRFTHALIRETLYEGMTGLRRAALHRAVGEALEDAHGGKADPGTVAELARHFLAATPTAGVGRAVEYATRAAAAATRACAYDEAVSYLRRAVQLCDERDGASDAPDAVRRCELQLNFAEALRRAGDGPEMRIAFVTAADMARESSEPHLFARAAIGVTGHWVREDQSAVQLLEESLACLPPDAWSLRALATSRLAKTLYLFADTRIRREQLCAEARDLARRSGDKHVIADVLADSLEALFHGDTLEEQDALAAELQEAAVSADDARLRLLSGSWQIVNAMRHGRLRDADARLAETVRLAGELRQPRFLHQAAIFDAALLLARGRLDATEARLREGLAIGIRIDEAMARWQHWIQVSHLRREQGRWEELLGEGQQLRLPPESLGAVFFERSVRWLAPHLFSELGREDEARASFESLMAQGLEGLPPENSRNTRIAALFSLGDACATIGDNAAAGPLYEALQPYADQWQVIGWGTVVFGSAHTILGALRSVQQRWSDADDHFEEALAQHDREHAICAQARALYQYARAVQRRGRRSDLARAGRLVDRGLTLAEEHGLRGVANRLRKLATS